MHIGLNAQLLTLKQNYRGAGINAYIFHLLRAIGELQLPHHFTVFLGERGFREENLDLHYTRWPTHHPLVRIVWEQLVLPELLRRAGVEVLHAMAFVIPLLARCPSVVTIYDLSFLRYPQVFRPFNRWYLSRFTPLSARRARRVIAISESTRQDVIQYLRVAPDCVDVIHCGVSPAFRPLPAREVERFRREHQLPEPFVLFVGTLEPRKNVDLLVRAYARWRARDTQAPRLVIAGAKGWYFETIFRTVAHLGLDDTVFFPGYISAEDLPLWYNAAGLFVYPSLFEGFGLPVLEAMACGTPVICSNASSLPEVAGDAAVLVAPDDEIGLAEAMRTVWESAGLRQTMIERGLARARERTWTRVAIQTVQTYQRALEV
ncbi:MAG: glycosyltransferase family 1 protein [Ardenticatenia bacterium]|jgi:glycosyltransferase involved in cell wall biosynthesis|nr:MAG: glycosyltransferase family 1 protein [Ardenticatenia bacterium]